MPGAKGGTREDAARSPAWRPVPGWRDLFADLDPDGILERLLSGEDDLRLRRLVAREVRAAAVLVDADRVHLRALARLVHTASVEGPPKQATWIESKVREAIADVVAAERAQVVQDVRRRQASGAGSTAPATLLDRIDESTAFDVLARPLGLDGQELRRACDTFNRRSDAEREAFFALVIDGETLEGGAARRGVTPTELAQRARRAFAAVLSVREQQSGPGTEADGVES